MATLTLNPAPSLYATSSATVTMAASGYRTILVSTTSQPTFTKNIGYDEFGNPFIAVLEDGRGNVLFDGGFPKFYNNAWDSAVTTYAALDNRFKFLYNAIGWLGTNNAPGTPKHILVYGDQAPSTGSYSVKGTAASDFNTSLSAIAALAGYTITFIDQLDYGRSATIPYSLMSAASCMLIFSSTTAAVNGGQGYLSAGSLANIQTYRQNGGGVMIVTDHDIFQATANQVAALFNASFSGNVDRSPVSVDALVTTYGHHPLWANMTGSVYAGSSEGIVNLPTNTPFNPATQSIQLSGTGYKTIYVTAEDDAGIVSARMFSYGFQVPDPITFTANLPTNTIFKYLDVPYQIDRIDSKDTSGFVNVNGTAIGQFQATSSSLTKSFYNSTFKPLLLQPGSSNEISLSISTPIAYSETSVIHVAPILPRSPIPAKVWSSLRAHETAKCSSKAAIYAAFRSQQGLTVAASPASALNKLNQYYASTYVAPVRRTVTVASGTNIYGYDVRPATATPYGSVDSTAVMFNGRVLKYFANYLNGSVWRTAVGFSRTDNAAQTIADFTGKRLRVVDSKNNLLLDVALTSAITSVDSGGQNGIVLEFVTGRYIYEAGTQFKIEIV